MSVLGQELVDDPVGPFQPRIFHESLVIGIIITDIIITDVIITDIITDISSQWHRLAWLEAVFGSTGNH